MRESYYDYMMRRSREEDAKQLQKELESMQEQRLPKARTVFDILRPNTIDEIARDGLEWHRNNIAEELANFYYRNCKMHPEDVAHYTELLPKFNAVCKFFGIEERGYDYYKDV